MLRCITFCCGVAEECPGAGLECPKATSEGRHAFYAATLASHAMPCGCVAHVARTTVLVVVIVIAAGVGSASAFVAGFASQQPPASTRTEVLVYDCNTKRQTL